MSSKYKRYIDNRYGMSLTVSHFWLGEITRRVESAEQCNVDIKRFVYLDMMRNMPHILKKWIIDNRPEDLGLYERMMLLI